MSFSCILPRLWRVCGALIMATGTIMGALVAHLPEKDFAIGGRAIAHVAMNMQMWHGLALILLGFIKAHAHRLLLIGGCGLLLGILLFCCSVYYTAFTGHHAAYMAPTGGSLLILSWFALALGWTFENK
ncbi:MAG: DUF423 domain-containing protein [Acetobacter sp.]|nr:DUF423 domain-containing protein [Acetobacter sp.]MBO6085196.1 DUF423 domain-containing protein [Acetobacter sp.]MBO6091404.1 DUF423 domain-containing protein [Acetobacter sp.]MBO7072314.1 DUF423 domain-containing protein [Acetobacter sp.]MBO7350772.1 DUF423 domain-containing protein [Acetobacter sp.]